MFPKALNDNVIVKPDVVSNQTESGLYIAPDDKKQRPTTGTVYSVGEDCYLSLNPHKILSPGCEVLFVKNAGHEMEHAGETYLILESKHLLAALSVV